MNEPKEIGKQFVSYAQNFEDVILWRALRHVSSGRYIDLGAQDPVVDSVSMGFYEHGWRGVNVEPNGHYAERLRAARPGEWVIQAAVGVAEGAIVFFEIADTGLSTGDAEIAEMHRERGFVVNPIMVPCLRLADILDQNAGQDIHWLKIDVEGMEQQVISSWQPSTVRPWVVVVESTRPNTTVPTFSSWEQGLTSLGYEFVYFDGLNRFYLSADHPELKQSFGYGPCIFDDFQLSGLAGAPFCRGVLEQAAAGQQEAERRAEQAAAGQQEAERRVEQAAAGQQEAERRAEQAMARQHEAERYGQQATARQHEAERYAEQAAARQHEAERYAEQAVARQHEAKQRAEQAAVRQHETERRMEHAEARRHEAERLITQIRASRSWRVTRPLRVTTVLMRRIPEGGRAWLTLKPGCRPRRVVRQCLTALATWIRAEPKRRALAARIRRRLAWLEKRLRVTRARPQLFQIEERYGVAGMPVAAAKIYKQLYRARFDRIERGETR